VRSGGNVAQNRNSSLCTRTTFARTRLAKVRTNLARRINEKRVSIVRQRPMQFSRISERCSFSPSKRPRYVKPPLSFQGACIGARFVPLTPTSRISSHFEYSSQVIAIGRRFRSHREIHPKQMPLISYRASHPLPRINYHKFPPSFESQ